MRLALFLIISLLLFGCKQEGPGPKEVVSKFLNALLHQHPVEAYQYISSKDKQTKSSTDFQAELSEGLNSPLKTTIVSKTSFEIKEILIGEEKSEAEVAISMPDFTAVFGDVMGTALASAFSGQSEEELQRMMTEKLSGKELPVVTKIETFELIKEQDGWRVYLNLEKKEKIDRLLSEAKDLQKKKKVYAAAEKYKKVLELDSESVLAKIGKNETEKDIASFEKKQSYIKNVHLKNFKVGKGRKYSFEDFKPAIYGTVENKGNNTLKKVEITVYFLDNTGNPIAEENYYPVWYSDSSWRDDNKALKPKYVKDFGYLVEDAAPSAWSGKAEAKITDIEFMD